MLDVIIHPELAATLGPGALPARSDRQPSRLSGSSATAPEEWLAAVARDPERSEGPEAISTQGTGLLRR
jgi:hypothetical protein